MEYTADEKNNRSRKLMCGSALLLTATVAVIVAVAVSKPEASDGDTDANVDPADPNTPVDPDTGYPVYEHHPMIDVYKVMPDFSALGTNDGSDVEMREDFWEDTWYGGALTDPFYKWDLEAPFESHSVNNNLMGDLNTEFDNIGEPGTYGRFNLKNIQSIEDADGAEGKFFVDIEFFAKDLEESTFNELLQLNNTLVTAETTEARKWTDYSTYANGYGRLVFYKVNGENQFAETGLYNPNDPENISVYKVYETYLENGYGNKEPMYGRIFEHEKNCLVGFLSYDTNPLKPVLEGKGFLVTQGEDVFKEGLWTTSIDTEPTTVTVINSLVENELVN